MKKKNKVLLVLVSVLLLTIGGSLAYFVARSVASGTGGKVVATTTTISGATLKVEGTIEFNDTDVYPGHTVVSGIKVTATGDNKLIPYNLVWNGLSEISGLNFKVYKTSSTVDVTSSCEKKMETVKGMQQYFEECEINNLDKLGTEIATGSINKNDTKVVLVKDEFITATSDGQVVYYYIILEYPNLDMNQKDDINATFEGKVTVEESNKKPDINILAVKLEQEDGTYKDSDDIPQEGYILNQEKSTCSNGATIEWDYYNKKLITSNLTKSGTSCYLTFDKYVLNSSTIIAAIKESSSYKTGTPTFTSVATGAETEDNNGVYETDDPMYQTTDNPNPKTYYWRGAATTNHVIFDNKCWRIVRINGDKSIRLIYNGTPSENTCTQGANSAAVIMGSSNEEKYYATSDGQYNNSSYVGWTYTLSTQRTTGGTASNAKTQTEKWYNSNISADAKEKVDPNGKFCNDRNTGAKYSEWSGTWTTTWSATGTQFAYAGVDRLWNKYTPTLSCPAGDVYALSVGAITADEVEFAGGKNENNTSYYLNAGVNYWTMSPFYWNSTHAAVFCVGAGGYLSSPHVNYTYAGVGLRPVINLKSDTVFAVDGNGTSTSPYVVP